LQKDGFIIPPPLPPESLLDPYFAPLHLAFMALIGACFGSFFNVCIYRIPRGVPLSLPPSHCYCCGSRVRWFDNIPLVSWWVLRGHCRTCHAPFSIRYWCIELLTALLYVGIAWQLGYTLALIPAILFVSLLIIATFTDIDHWIIPDRISIGGLVAGLVLAAIWPVGNAPGNPLVISFIDAGPHWTPLANAAAGAAAGFGGLWAVGAIGTLIFRKDAMGFGDVKLFGMFGAFCGLTPLLYLLLIACVIGTLIGVAGMLAGALARGRAVPAAIGPLQLAEGEIDALLECYPLAPGEVAVLRPVLREPGSVGPIRHHLPFGPSLAIAALVIYLYHPQIASHFERWIATVNNVLWR
jgi:leader peptidase (prepilin peptidase)/N-methyltransferase